MNTTQQENDENNNYEFKRSNTYLANKYLSASNYKTSKNNLSQVSDFNLSRACLSLADNNNSNRPVTVSNNRNRKIVQVLILLTLSFTISTLPSSLFYSYFRPIFNDKPYRRLLTNSFNLLRHLSHTFNFIIYFTSSSIIKQQLKDIIRDLNNKKSIQYLKGKLSCFIITRPNNNNNNNNNNKQRSSFNSSNTNINNNNKNDTHSINERKNFEETSHFLNTDNLPLMSKRKEDHKFEMKITKVNVTDEKKSENYLNQDKDNPNPVEFESISFHVPSISNSKKNKK